MSKTLTIEDIKKFKELMKKERPSSQVFMVMDVIDLLYHKYRVSMLTQEQFSKVVAGVNQIYKVYLQEFEKREKAE